MSDKNNFAGGFLLGTLVGGVLGGVLGTVLASKNNSSEEENENNSLFKSSSSNQEITEDTRLGLEDKINLLNHAIDDVRVTLLKNVSNPEKEALKE